MPEESSLDIWLVVRRPGERGWHALGVEDVLSDGKGAIIYETREQAEVAAGADEVDMAGARRSVE